MRHAIACVSADPASHRELRRRLLANVTYLPARARRRLPG
jgi:hypothetical protein